MSKFQPMLACRERPDTSKLPYPMFASPKLDGIRAMVRSEIVLSRTLKSIPNLFVQDELARFHGLDGELIVGDPTAPDVYRNTVSGVMSIQGAPDFTYYVFDSWWQEDHPYEKRTFAARHLGASGDAPRIKWLPQVEVRNEDQLLQFEHTTVQAGYEGVILRRPGGRYKFGRSTMDEALLLKLKRFEDSEAIVLGVIEELANTNEAKPDERGYTKRSSHKAGKVGKGTMGALHVRDVKTGAEFDVGTGFTTMERLNIWHDQARTLGRTLTYKFFPVGVKDLPRHPVFKGWRDHGA